MPCQYIPIRSTIHTTIYANTYNKTQYLPILTCNFTDGGMREHAMDARHAPSSTRSPPISAQYCWRHMLRSHPAYRTLYAHPTLPPASTRPAASATAEESQA